MGGRGIRGLKARVGQKCCISRGGGKWARLNSGGIQAGDVRKGRYSVVGVGSPQVAETQQGGQLQE